jgi:elongation factor Ts
LEKFDGDYNEAYEDLMKKVSAKAAKKADRTAGDGLVHSYIHNTGKLGSMIVVACETDFVAKTDDFQHLCKEIAMQVCTDNYEDVEAVVNAPYMRDESKTIGDLIEEAIAKLGEKIELKKFTKYSVSDE